MNFLQYINELGIRHHNKINSDNWLQCHCISGIHKDNNPSMGIQLDTGIINCFSCGYSSNIYKVISQRQNISYKEAIKYVHGDTLESIPKDPIQNLIQNKNNFLEQEIHKTPIQNYNFVCTKFDNPSDYEYTRLRGFTKEFCKEFDIKIALSGLYTDYIIIPIVDTEQQFISFEARKLLQTEKLKVYNHLNKDEINKWLLNTTLQRRIDILDFIYDKKKKGIELTQLEEYLIRNKVLYPKTTKVNCTIFNIDNLKYNEDLILVEGIASIPKIYQYYNKNVTSIFGCNLSIEQIKILKQFKRILIISDNDIASYQMINMLQKYHDNVCVFDCITKDTEIDFIDKLKNSKVVSASQFLINRLYKI